MKTSKNGNKKIILRDDQKRVFAVCSKETSGSSFTYRIFGTVPTLEGQRPAKKTSNSRMGIYDWAEVVGSPRRPRYSLRIWDGEDFAGTYTCTKNSVLNKYHFDEHGVPCGTMEKSPQSAAKGAWQISVLPGFNRCLMICFAAVVDDLLDVVTINEQQSLRDMAKSLSGMISNNQFNQKASTVGENSLDSTHDNVDNNASAASIDLTDAVPRSDSSCAAS